MHNIFIPPLSGHNFTFQCSVWHICVQTVNIWTEISTVTSRVWVMVIYCFKNSRSKEKKLETGECHPCQGSLSPSLTSFRNLWLFPNPAVLATAHMFLPGPSPGPVPWQHCQTMSCMSCSSLPLLICWHPSVDNAFFLHTPLPLTLLAFILSPRGSTKGQ